MGYEDAPATKMLATHCAVCARSLVDAVSVNSGIGPECRKKWGYFVDVDEEAREEANKLVHMVAVEQTGANAAKACERLRELGFVKLADRILQRVVDVMLEEVSGGYLVRFAYDEVAVAAIRGVPGRRWDKEAKAWYVPATSKRELWSFLNVAFFSALVDGPKGVFRVEKKEETGAPRLSPRMSPTLQTATWG